MSYIFYLILKVYAIAAASIVGFHVVMCCWDNPNRIVRCKVCTYNHPIGFDCTQPSHRV